MTSTPAIAARQYTHPLVFLLLIIPFGAISGFITVTIAYMLAKAGVDAVTISVLTGLSFLPHTFKFVYAPIVDLTWKRKHWFVLSCIVSAAGIALLGLVPATQDGLPWLRVVVVVGNFAVAFLSLSVESLMAYNTAPSQLGRTAGWFQAGNLGGGGLGGGLALVIAEHAAQPWLPGVVLAIICLLTGLAIRYTTEPEPHLPALPDERDPQVAAQHAQRFSVWREMYRVLVDLWHVLRSRPGYLALLICFLPIGSGAAGGLFPLFANEWGASANDVAATSGALSGLLSAVGCMVGGFFCDRLDRKTAYAIFGIIMSACAALMALAPHTLNMYYVFVLGYGFINGLCFAAYTAVTLEAIGTGAAATKFSIYSSLSNVPIAYMGILNGYFYDKFGSNAGLFNDAAMGIAGVVFFVLMTLVSKNLHQRYAQRRLATSAP